MAPRQGNVFKLAWPLKTIIQRSAFLALVSLAVGLLFLGKANIAAVDRLRMATTDFLAPVLTTISEPVSAFHRAVARVQSLTRLIEENERLREENARLLKWQAAGRALEQENENFRQLLNALSDPLVLPITARVIGDSGGPFVRTLLLNAGQRDGVRVGQAVVAPLGLIGRIAEVGDRSARVLLITDINSRIPVVLEKSRQKGILVGDNSTLPLLEFLPTTSTVAPGDRLVTSGDGGMLPAGRPIGFVSSVGERDIRVQGYADWNRLEYVSILRYDLPGMSGPEDNPGDLGESRLGESRLDAQ
ncbi:MAG: rod shape-determining protein MreC [Sneathiella sp.]|jgi:rod shape-determining protein MreC|uniref:rod shape-determining protein MreC n=1 Tax=Sneathiella sp. TaxID=1964365 RepID=UPI000C510F87|nr:rod shape-determining protein MreC [Sneathiella sp.]MAL78154.1 rod shape-determining protein MreC [Sneathiella sp.]